MHLRARLQHTATPILRRLTNATSTNLIPIYTTTPSRMFTSRFWNDPLSSSQSTSIFDSDPFFLGRRAQQHQQGDQQEEKYQGATTSRTGTSDEASKKTTTGQLPSRVSRRQDDLLSMPSWGYDPFSRLSMWSPFGIDRDFQRMNRVMNRMMSEDLDRDLGNDPNATSYNVSSSSYTHLGADGKPVISTSTRREHRRVGDVIEENESVRDLVTGAERQKSRRGLANKIREVIRDRNADGEERKIENLQGINQNEVEQFDSQWNEAMKKYESQRQLLGLGDQSNQQQIAGGIDKQPRLESGLNAKQAPVANVPTTDAKKTTSTTRL
jgi:hypothetical protein